MPEYKLIYFNGRGRAEITRWIFIYAGIPFEDERVERENWAAMKSTIPFGKLPCLMIDKMALVQSTAIIRYVARQAGLWPEDQLHAAWADAVIDTMFDIGVELYKLRQITDEAEKKKKHEEIWTSTVVPVLSRIEKRLAEGREWVVGDKISNADLALGSALGDVLAKHEKFLDSYPKLAAHVKKVRELPKIKEWIEKRPPSEF